MDEQLTSQSLLTSRVAELGFVLDLKQVRQLNILTSELAEWSQRFNLTSIIEPSAVSTRHLLDSLTLAPLIRGLLPTGEGSLVDVGSGGGFPGLPIAVVFPSVSVTLVEATAKKVTFLQHAIEEMGLEHAEAAYTTAEDFARREDRRGRYDVAVARAVGSVAVLVELLLPLLRVGGAALLMKKLSAVDDEVRDAAGALAALAGEVERVVDVGIGDLLPDRAVIVIRKIGDTPDRFPRRSGIPRKRPLTNPGR